MQKRRYGNKKRVNQNNNGCADSLTHAVYMQDQSLTLQN